MWYLEAFSSRHDVSIFDAAESFSKAVGEQEEYMFSGGFDLYEVELDDEYEEVDPKELIATVRAVFFDEDKILNEGQDIVDIADMTNSDTCGAIAALTKSKIHNQQLDDDKLFLPLFSSYIQRIYVYPKFRSSGVARYIFNNMADIFLHCFNTNIHSFVICPKPQQPDIHGNWSDSPDENDTMLKRMILLLKKSGYKKIYNSEYYAVNCAI